MDHNLVALNFFNSLIIPLGLGYIIVSNVMKKHSPFPFFLNLAFGYCIGLGLISYMMFLCGLFELPLNILVLPQPLSSILSLTLGVFIVYYEISNRKKNDLNHRVKKDKQINEISLFGVFLKFFIIIQLLIIFFQSLSYPIAFWDAVSSISFKAKVFFYDQSLQELRLPHAAYPLFTPLIQAWQSFHLGYWDGVLVKSTIPIGLVAFICIYYFFLRNFISSIYSKIGIVLLLASNFFIFHTTIGYRDVFMSFYNCAAIMLLILWFQRRERGILILAGLFSGLSSFVKLEGKIYILIHLLLFLFLLFQMKDVLRVKIKNFILFLCLNLFFAGIFHLYKLNLGIEGMAGRMQLVFNDQTYTRFLEINSVLLKILFSGSFWNLLWVLLIWSIVKGWERLRNNIAIMTLFISLIVYFSAYMVFLIFRHEVIPFETYLPRIILHFYPLCPLLIILLNAPKIKSLDTSHL